MDFTALYCRPLSVNEWLQSRRKGSRLSVVICYWNVPVNRRTAQLARVTEPVKVPPAVADTVSIFAELKSMFCVALADPDAPTVQVLPTASE